MEYLAVVKAAVNDLVNLKALGQITSYGGWLVIALLTIRISWDGIKMLLEGESGNSMIASLVGAFVVAGFATAVIGGSAIGQSGTTGGLGRELASGFNTLARTVSGVDTSDPGGVVEKVLAKSMATTARMMTGKTDAAEEAKPTTSGVEAIVDVAKTTFGEVMNGTLLAMIADLFYKFAMAVLILLATLIFLAQFIFTQVMVNIGLLFMPLLVPFVILEATKFLFDGWLNFVIKAGMAKVIGAVMYALSVGAVNSAIDLADQGYQAGSGWAMFAAYSTSFLLVGLMAFLMLQTTSVAEGLISGRGLPTWRPVGKTDPAKGVTKAGEGAGRLASVPMAGAGGAASGWKTGRAASAGKGAAAQFKSGVVGAARGAKAGVMTRAQQVSSASARKAREPFVGKQGPSSSSGGARNPSKTGGKTP